MAALSEPTGQSDALVWQGGLTAHELADVRVGLITRLSVAQSNARGEKPGTQRRRHLEQRAATLQALLDKLRPADGRVDALPQVEG